jgi:methionine biosynthesis protein MetW
VKNIDHYGHWYTGDNKVYIIPRERSSLEIMKKLKLDDNSVILDAGCGDGRFTQVIKKSLNREVKGLEYSKEGIAFCKKKGLDVRFADFNDKIPFSDKSFDVIYAGEVIEHLYDPDKFLQECYRVLKDDGYLIITTPNLCNWYNRILMLFGIQPVFIETSTIDTRVGAGVLEFMKKDHHPVGHVRIFNSTALEDIFNLHNFCLVKKQGEVFEHFPSKLSFLDRFFKNFYSLSSGFVVVAKKVK